MLTCSEENGCPSNQFCLPSSSNEGEGICICSGLYGWRGENCDIQTAAGVYQQVINIIDIIWSILLFLLIFRTLFFNYRLADSAKELFGNPIFITSGLILVSSLSLLAYGIFQLRALFDPQFLEVSNYKEIFKRENINRLAPRGGDGILETMFLLLYLATLSFSTFFLTESWESVLRKLRRFFTVGLSEQILRKGYYLLLVLYVIYLFVFILLRNILALIVGTLFIFIINTSVFVLKAYRFNQALKSFDITGDSRVRATIKLIRHVAIVNMVCSVGVVIFSSVFFLTLRRVSERKDGALFNYSFLFRDIAILFGLVTETTMAWYINATTEGIILTEDIPICTIFYYWDKKNLEIFPDKIEADLIDDNLKDEKKDEVLVKQVKQEEVEVQEPSPISSNVTIDTPRITTGEEFRDSYHYEI